MTVETAVFRFAGLVVLASVALAHWVNSGFLWVTAFAGLSLLVAGFTGFCPAAMAFKKLGVRTGNVFK
ncbi:DUF2892 domain-containing protein [Novosphingobium sp. ERN07]|uniref:YgaP family membrane protein n=1 Tax=Novosphingobium sp. ERN07 TaxID=2726187 RepID=UPI001456A602|nr:DUF2892 domain-containing protein [Novosphingobium sp. ERN07]NLR71389.1 DUF2892 domain-containing protein [Novosphingobium sp. ERN07]